MRRYGECAPATEGVEDLFDALGALALGPLAGEQRDGELLELDAMKGRREGQVHVGDRPQ